MAQHFKVTLQGHISGVCLLLTKETGGWLNFQACASSTGLGCKKAYVISTWQMRCEAQNCSCQPCHSYGQLSDKGVGMMIVLQGAKVLGT